MNIQDSVLYGLMTFGPDCWYEHGTMLQADMFSGERREIFDAIAKLNHQGEAVNMLLVADSVTEEGAELVQELMGQNFIKRREMKSSINHLRRAYLTNRAKDVGAELIETGDIETAKAALMGLDTGETGNTIGTQDANKLFMDELQARTEGEFGLKTGLADLDGLLCGLEPSDLCVVASRPSMGKTAFMLNVALSAGCPVGIFSLEMSTGQLMTRLVASHGVDYGRLKRPKLLTDSDWSKITKATSGLNDLWINDTPSLSIGAIEGEAHRMVKAFGVGLICVDYLQLITNRAENRLETVSDISRRLKGIAKRQGIPVLALCQMNRAVEKRGNPTPIMSDLRESGQIEQDADQIIFIHRPEVLDEGIRPGEADLIVSKNRGGEIGTVKTSWQGHYQRFANLAWGAAA